MPEISHGIEAPSDTEVTPSPLSPETYKSYSVQRKIIGFYATGGDSIVFKRNDFEATQKQTKDFEEAIAHRRFGADELSDMLQLIPDGLNGEDKFKNYSEFCKKLSQDEVMQQIMATLSGVEDTKDLDPGDIANFLYDNLTPVEVSDKLDKLFEYIRKEFSDPEMVLAYEEISRDLLVNLYKDRFIYYQNFRLLHDKVFQDLAIKNPLRLSKSSTSRRVLGRAPSLALGSIVGFSSVWGAAHLARDYLQDGRIDGPFEPQIVHSTRQETEKENETEKKYDIEILDVREAFNKLGKDFNIYDKNALGRNPPSWWSEEQIILLDEYLSRLPHYFYEPLGDEKLSFALTDYGEECPCAGTYHENQPNLSSSMVFLSDGSFIRQSDEWSFKLLTHELMHRVDIDLSERKLGEKATEMLGFDDFVKAREHFMPLLNQGLDNGNINASMHHDLNYGFMGINNNGLSRPTEFIAKLGEIYVGGKEEFMEMARLFGREKTENLYEFVKNEIFEGKEYGSSLNPIMKQQNLQDENSNFEIKKRNNKKKNN